MPQEEHLAMGQNPNRTPKWAGHLPQNGTIGAYPRPYGCEFEWVLDSLADIIQVGIHFPPTTFEAAP